MRLITFESSMSAISLSRSPQRGHVRTWQPTLRCINSAHSLSIANSKLICKQRTLFWTAADLEMKLLDFQRYYNGHRTHAGLDGRTPESRTEPACVRASVGSYRWQPHCRGLSQTPMAA
jgi:hypothetical protein